MDQLEPRNRFQCQPRIHRYRISTQVLGCLEVLSSPSSPRLGRNRCMHNNQRITAVTLASQWATAKEWVCGTAGGLRASKLDTRTETRIYSTRCWD